MYTNPFFVKRAQIDYLNNFLKQANLNNFFKQAVSIAYLKRLPDFAKRYVMGDPKAKEVLDKLIFREAKKIRVKEADEFIKNTGALHPEAQDYTAYYAKQIAQHPEKYIDESFLNQLKQKHLNDIFNHYEKQYARELNKYKSGMDVALEGQSNLMAELEQLQRQYNALKNTAKMGLSNQRATRQQYQALQNKYQQAQNRIQQMQQGIQNLGKQHTELRNQYKQTQQQLSEAQGQISNLERYKKILPWAVGGTAVASLGTGALLFHNSPKTKYVYVNNPYNTFRRRPFLSPNHTPYLR